MAKIRDDLIGVVYARSGVDILRLEAGDDIPEGAEVGNHLIAETSPPKRRGRPAKASDDAGDED